MMENGSAVGQDSGQVGLTRRKSVGTIIKEVLLFLVALIVFCDLAINFKHCIYNRFF